MRVLPCFLLLGLAGCGARSALSDGKSSNASPCDPPERTGSPGQVVVKDVNEIGALDHPSTVTFRDGGSFAKIGDRGLWTFADTLFNSPSADGKTFRSSTAAYAAPHGDLLQVDDQVDDSGAPFQLIPFTVEEQAFNDAGSGDDRWALWPFATVDGCDGSAMVFYGKVRIKPGFLNFRTISVGRARLVPPSTVAARAPDFVFSGDDKMFLLGGLRDGSFLYLYACEPVTMGLDQDCQVARAPFDLAGDRSAYTFWDGAKWNEDVQSAATVFHGPAGDVSVSWNEHLNAFIAVHSGIFSPDIMIHTAPRPEGPWSPAMVLMNGIPSASDPNHFNYAGKEHPELSPDGGKTLVITYAHPLGDLSGELRVAEVTLE